MNAGPIMGRQAGTGASEDGTPSALDVPDMPVAVFAIDVPSLGLRYPCRADETLLGAMERAGRRGIPVGCRGGGCGICRVRVLAGHYHVGRMSVVAVSAAQRQAGMALACCVWPRSDVTLALESPPPHLRAGCTSASAPVAPTATFAQTSPAPPAGTGAAAWSVWPARRLIMFWRTLIGVYRNGSPFLTTGFIT